jgi:hypothetical protein
VAVITMTAGQRVGWEAEVRSLYDSMVRIVVTPPRGAGVAGALTARSRPEISTLVDVEDVVLASSQDTSGHDRPRDEEGELP